MDTLLEFLESSTIHGLSYLSTARVCFIVFFPIFIFFLSDKISKDSLVSCCLPWIHRGWNPYRQVVQGVAG